MSEEPKVTGPGEDGMYSIEIPPWDDKYHTMPEVAEDLAGIIRHLVEARKIPDEKARDRAVEEVVLLACILQQQICMAIKADEDAARFLPTGCPTAWAARKDNGRYGPLPDWDAFRTGLPVRCRKVLVRLNVTNFDELLKYSGEGLLECKNFGETTLAALRHALAAVGLALCGDRPVGVAR